MKLLIELYDPNIFENNVYQAFLTDADHLLFLAMDPIDGEEFLALERFLLAEVGHLNKVWFVEANLETLREALNQFCPQYDQVVVDVFGGDALLAVGLYDYAIHYGYEIIALDLGQGRHYRWLDGELHQSPLRLPHLSLEQSVTLRGGSVIQARQPLYRPTQQKAIRDLAVYSLKNQLKWYQATQYFSLIEVDEELTAEVPTSLKHANGRIYSYPRNLASLLEEAGIIKVHDAERNWVKLSYPSKHARLLATAKGFLLENYLYLMACDSGAFDEVLLGLEVDWNGIYPELNNVQNELDVVLRRGRQAVVVSCKMTEATPAAINELLLYAQQFWGDDCLKVFVCTGLISPAYAKRCQEYGIVLIDAEQVRHFVSIVLRHLDKV